MTFSACSNFEQDKDAIFNGEENITFADLSQVPAKEFQVLENSIELSQGITRACAGAGFMQYFGRL
jgi:hypothetical protein